ncbi:MAG TPA: hypothetical protein VKP88_06070 [Candidatus Paceibacterota bacterium]|nr:hypothetical protein [Candidatus Paceibacterota bacterium]
MFSLEAYVKLIEVDGINYCLFYDYKAKRHLVALINSQTSALVSIWYTNYNFPESVKVRIDADTKSLAVRLVRRKVTQESKPQSDVLKSIKFLHAEVTILTSRRNPLITQIVGKFDPTNYHESNREDILYFFASDILRLAAISGCERKQTKSFRCKLTFYSDTGDQMLHFTYKRIEVLRSLPKAYAELIVSNRAESFQIPLGFINTDVAKNCELELLFTFKNQLSKITQSVTIDMGREWSSQLHYQIQVRDPEYGFIITSIGREHESLLELFSTLTT